MEVHKFTGKDYEEVKKEALEKLNLTEKDVIVYCQTKKGGLFKSDSVELIVTPLADVIEYIKEYLNSLRR